MTWNLNLWGWFWYPVVFENKLFELTTINGTNFFVSIEFNDLWQQEDNDRKQWNGIKWSSEYLKRLTTIPQVSTQQKLLNFGLLNSHKTSFVEVKCRSRLKNHSHLRVSWHWINFRMAYFQKRIVSSCQKIQTWAGSVGSTNATYLLCRPPFKGWVSFCITRDCFYWDQQRCRSN